MNQEKMLQDIFEIVSFIKENAATRDELREVDKGLRQEMYRLDCKIEAVDEKLTQTKSDLFEHIDHFITLHQKLEIELTSMRAKYERLEQLVYKMARQLNIQVET